MIPRAVCIALTLVLFGAVPAMAAKEKFERSKPHVNVGTTGQVAPGESIMTTVSLLSLSRVTGESRAELPCSAEFDIRYLNLGDPAAPPLAERLAVRAAANESVDFGFTHTGTVAPLSIAFVIIARNPENVDGVNCVLRGVMSVLGAGGQTRRTLAVKPEDFITYRLPDEGDPPR